MLGHGVLAYNDSNEIDKAMKEIQKEREEQLNKKDKQPIVIEKGKDDYEL